MDIAATALRQAREHAETLGADIAGRIDRVRAGLTGWAPPGEHFDLVTAHYVHPTGPRGELVRRPAAAVAPGGTLLVVDHHPSGHRHSPSPEVHATAEDVAADLDPDRWDVLVADDGTRAVTGPHGREVTLRDAVLRARERP